MYPDFLGRLLTKASERREVTPVVLTASASS